MRDLADFCHLMSREFRAAADRTNLEDVRTLLLQREHSCASRACELERALAESESPNVPFESFPHDHGDPAWTTDRLDDVELVDACGRAEDKAFLRYVALLEMTLLPPQWHALLLRQLSDVRFDPDLLYAMHLRLSGKG